MNDSVTYDYHTHYEISKPKIYYTKKGLCGMTNLGNKCFMNSIIQCLSNTLKLTDYFVSRQHQIDLADNTIKAKNRKEYELVNSYLSLLENIWQSNKLIKPKSFVDILSKILPKYNNSQQQDSHEFLLYFLDTLHKGICYEIDVEIQGDIKTQTDILMKKYLDSWKLFYEKQYSFLVENLGGMYYNKIKCNNCNFEEDIFEPFNVLSIDIPSESTSSLKNCINTSFNNKETIETWKCEQCKQIGCTKNTSIWNIPNYLIIHLKRFTNNGKKNQKLIDFSLNDINITNTISAEKKDPNNYIYSLYAINYHSGSLNSGHYWSCCKNLDNNWYIFNDGHVSRFHNTNDLLTKDAYILFYYRKFIPQKDE